MRAQLTVWEHEGFTVFLSPETRAEREILRRVAEAKKLIVQERLQYIGRSVGAGVDRIEIIQAPPAVDDRSGVGEVITAAQNFLDWTETLNIDAKDFFLPIRPADLRELRTALEKYLVGDPSNPES